MRLPAKWNFKIDQSTAFCYNQWGGAKAISASGSYNYTCPIYVHSETYSSDGAGYGYSFDSTGAPMPDPNYIGEVLDDNNQFMYPGDGLLSANGDWTLVYQNDGNLMEYNADYLIVWSSGTDGSGGGNAHVHLQDGNLVIYDYSTTPVFTTGTGGHSGAYLVMQNSGNIVIYDSGGSSVLWATSIP